MPETGEITKANLHMPVGVCIDDMDAIAQAINQIGEVTGDSIINLQQQILNITTATCEVLEECEFPIPPDFPETDPTTIENIIISLWTAISECCGQNLECVEVVEDVVAVTANQDFVTAATLQAQVVNELSLQTTVVTAVSFDEEECILSVTTNSQSFTYGSQSRTISNLDYIDDVEVTPREIYVGTCPEE